MNFLRRLFVLASVCQSLTSASANASPTQNEGCEALLGTKPVSLLIATVARKLDQDVSVSLQVRTKTFSISEFNGLQNRIRANSLAAVELQNILADGRSVSVQIAISGKGLEALKALTVIASEEMKFEWLAPVDQKLSEEALLLRLPKTPENEAKMVVKIEDLELPIRAWKALKDANITYIGDLIHLQPEALLRLNGFGRKSMNEVVQALTLMDLRLGTEVPWWPPENLTVADDASVESVRLSRILNSSLRGLFYDHTVEALNRSGIFTVEQLVSQNEREIFGKLTFDREKRQILDFLQKNELRFGMTIPAGSVKSKLSLEQMNDLMASPISRLGLSVRAMRAMLANDVQTIGDALKLGYNAILRTPNASRVTANEIESKLFALGLQLPH